MKRFLIIKLQQIYEDVWALAPGLAPSRGFVKCPEGFRGYEYELSTGDSIFGC